MSEEWEDSICNSRTSSQIAKCVSENWIVSLGKRNNLLYNDIPYVPILVENISKHCSCDDYEKNCVKTIQTMGEIVPKSWKSAHLRTLTPGNHSEFPIYFHHLKERDIYIQKNSCHQYIWDQHIVFKIYGTLMLMGKQHALEATHLVPVQDIVGTWNMFTLLSVSARSKYHQYYRTEGQHRMLEAQWDKMKKEKKRKTQSIMQQNYNIFSQY